MGNVENISYLSQYYNYIYLYIYIKEINIKFHGSVILTWISYEKL